MLEHIIVAEKALGYFLPDGAEVHHVNKIKSDNANTNLVICENRAFHHLLHVRARVVAAGGDPNTDKICCKCKAVKPKLGFHRNTAKADGLQATCKPCFLGTYSTLRAAKMHARNMGPATRSNGLRSVVSSRKGF